MLHNAVLGAFYIAKKFLKSVNLWLTNASYKYILISETEKRGNKNMTKAEKNAIKARKNDLIKQGIDKEFAEVMARVELETGLIKTVVNY